MKIHRTRPAVGSLLVSLFVLVFQLNCSRESNLNGDASSTGGNQPLPDADAAAQGESDGEWVLDADADPGLGADEEHDLDEDGGIQNDTELEPDADEPTQGDPGVDPDGDEGTDVEPDPVSEQCAGLSEGRNNGFLVNGLARNVVLNFPADIETGGPFAVIFNWHGFGDSPENMSNLLKAYVDDPQMPFIQVLPEDTGKRPPAGFDWDVLKITEPNQEVALYDDLLACLKARFPIDETHIHAVGFSAGGIAVDLLGTLRGSQLASLVSYSGAYFSNQNTHDLLIRLLRGFVAWPAFNHDNRFVQVFLHGGQNDKYNLLVQQIPFNEFAQSDAVFLNERGHDVILCNHNQGHSVPRAFFGSQVFKFFKTHPWGTIKSPYHEHGLPSDFPEYCELLP